MGTIRVRIDSGNGSPPEEMELDLSLDSLTMRESVRVEEVLGPDRFRDLVTKGLQSSVAASPSVIQAVVFAKLATIRPDVTRDGFDLDLEDLQNAMEVPAESPLDEGSKE